MNLKRIIVAFRLGLLILFPPAISLSAGGEPLPQFLLMTEKWPPYNFEKDGRPQGISVDILELMLKKIGSSQRRKDIMVYPWARGYLYLQKKPNSILFSTTKSREREPLFKWVGPIFKNSIGLYALKHRGIRIQSPRDFKRFKVATYFNDAGEQTLGQ